LDAIRIHGDWTSLLVSLAFRQLRLVTTATKTKMLLYFFNRFFGKSNQAGMSSSLSSGITPLRSRDGNTRTE
jgi:hypothetical protein